MDASTHIGKQFKVSSSSGTDTISLSDGLTTWLDVANLSVTITTHGRPVYLSLVSVEGSTQSQIETSTSDATQVPKIRFLRDSTSLGEAKFGIEYLATANAMAFKALPGNINTVDPGATAGTHTYKFQVYLPASGMSMTFRDVRLMALEL